ncbi:YwqG family protein [Enterococcus sp. LJL51]|uniref:YwqG family protein n=1 Tax=Enterococcus sp. LJL51 TaxID=3416656 RepID=UPI003CEDD7E7
MENELRDLLPEFWQKKFESTKKEYIKLTFSNEGPLDLKTSKAGGVGYLPVTENYPRNTETGMPLFLLTQINFEELPVCSGFPEKGILAFYVDYTDDLIGVDYEQSENRAGYHVFYFKDDRTTSYTKEQQEEIQKEAVEGNELYAVVDGEFRITGSLDAQILNTDSYEFKKIFGKTMFEWLKDITDDSELEEKIYNALHKGATGSKIGGYPFFTQEDPRIYEAKTEYDTLLFQLDTEKIGDSWSIMWGDMGVANFFINHQALQQKDFTKILYNWDCG